MVMAKWSVFDPGPGHPGSLSTIGRPPRESPDLFKRVRPPGEKDSSDQQIEQILVKGKCHASGMYILMYHNSAYIFPMISRYFLHLKLKYWLEIGGLNRAQAISSKLVFFLSFFWRKPCHLGLRPHHSSSHIGISQGNAAVICDMWGDLMLAARDLGPRTWHHDTTR